MYTYCFFLCIFLKKTGKEPKSEIKFLFNLINSYFSKEIESVLKQGIKINILGEINALPKEIKKTLKKFKSLQKKKKLLLI